MKILYTSRTHSQLKQVKNFIGKKKVVKELKSTCYEPSQIIIGSRDQMCVNEDIRKKNLRGVALSDECAIKCKSKSNKNREPRFLSSP